MSDKNDSFVCPESAVESANQRNKPLVPKSSELTRIQDSSGSGSVPCESTIESANRRDFIRKAAVMTAAAGIGGVLLGSGNIVPKSAAKSAYCCRCCTVLGLCLLVDSLAASHPNDGAISPCQRLGTANALLLGCFIVKECGCYIPGQAIGSAVVCGSPNLYGLDFYTDYKKRMSITNCGKVGIGTSAPSSTLEVDGPTKLESTLAVSGSTALDSTLVVSGSTTLDSTLAVGGSTTLDSTLYVKGKVGIGTCSPGCYTFNVNAPNQNGVHIQGPSSCVGAALSFQTNGSCAQGWEILDTGATSAQGKKKLNIRNLTTVKDVFTICGPNSYIGINNTAPGSALCVVGEIRGKGTVLGVYGIGCCFGVGGLSNNYVGVYGSGKTNGVQGVSSDGHGVAACSTAGTALLATVHCKAGIPIVAKGATCQTAPLQEWQNSSGTVKSAINPCGWLGLGATSAPTTLHVNGSMSAKVAFTGSKNYCMGASDFAVFACAPPVTVTLPPAATATGMIVFVKNTGTASVTVAPKSGDSIEGNTTGKILTKEYDGLELISNGKTKWMVLGNSIGDAFTS
jgi:hypothetical protein